MGTCQHVLILQHIPIHVGSYLLIIIVVVVIVIIFCLVASLVSFLIFMGITGRTYTTM